MLEAKKACQDKMAHSVCPLIWLLQPATDTVKKLAKQKKNKIVYNNIVFFSAKPFNISTLASRVIA